MTLCVCVHESLIVSRCVIVCQCACVCVFMCVGVYTLEIDSGVFFNHSVLCFLNQSLSLHLHSPVQLSWPACGPQGAVCLRLPSVGVSRVCSTVPGFLGAQTQVLMLCWQTFPNRAISSVPTLSSVSRTLPLSYQHALIWLTSQPCAPHPCLTLNLPYMSSPQTTRAEPASLRISRSYSRAVPVPSTWPLLFRRREKPTQAQCGV